MHLLEKVVLSRGSKAFLQVWAYGELALKMLTKMLVIWRTSRMSVSTPVRDSYTLLL
jgi:hypothetical protein